MSKIVLKYSMGYHADILRDVVAARRLINYCWSHGSNSTSKMYVLRTLYAAGCLLLHAAGGTPACCFSEGWVAGCQIQLFFVGVVAKSLLRHTWSICLLGVVCVDFGESHKIVCLWINLPTESMYGISNRIWGILMVNVSKYTIHGVYGYNLMINNHCPSITTSIQSLS